ncbi:hypothetical protein [uncultured Aquimarina sp.]|uniref:hypothetical protein n=1 Tax=uncultured Aquimarina sp. TaxID=575652 RepID=UPI002639C0AD|nr:hypothetical protein [uncultured Aquimarina sp.]
MGRIVFITVMLLAKSMFGQEIMSSSGFSVFDENVQVYYTIGELAVTEMSNSDITLNQGFHQGFKIERFIQKDEVLVDIKVWPNPVVNSFNIKTNSSAISYALYNKLQQKTSIKGQVPIQTTQSIEIGNLEPAIYLLYVTDRDNNTNVYRILKTD